MQTLVPPGLYTLMTLAKKMRKTEATTLNLVCKLKKQGYIRTSGGKHQPRIYNVSNLPLQPTNGFYDLVNKYTEPKLHPAYRHYVFGNYTIERAIIDGLRINNYRELHATKHLFNHVTDWTGLFNLAKKYDLKEQLLMLYEQARKEMKVRKIPKRYKR